MSPVRIQFSPEEITLAWKRLKADRPDRCFADHPFLCNWIDADLQAWVGELQRELEVGYVPSSSQVCRVPKAGALVRPGGVLSLKDEVVYNVLVGRLFPLVAEAIGPFQGDPDVAYQLGDRADETEWIRSGFHIWRQWRERSVAKLAADCRYVVVSDITGFYDNIDIGRLVSDIRSVGGTGAEVQLLTECLNKWCHPRGKGVMQGFSASDILAKLYMNPIDRAIQNSGVQHLRYVDDFRVFLRTERDCRAAIAMLSELMHDRGLNLQSAKTKILTRDQAASEFDGVTSIIQDIQVRLKEELTVGEELNDEYVPSSEIERLLKERANPTSVVLERAFQEHFLEDGAPAFDKTLFHFLLTRLANAGSGIAINYCIESLATRPEETEYLLRYLGKLGLNENDRERVASFLHSGDTIYDYQLYQVLRWFVAAGESSGGVLRFCRGCIADRNRDRWLRSYAIAYLARFGDGSDLERLERLYADLGNEIERADCVYGLRNLERSRRNSIYGRVEGESGLVKRAVDAAKR